MNKKLSALLMIPSVVGLMLFANNALSASPDLTVLSYNIHHGEGTDGVIDLNRIAQVINSVNPDIVALQEVDRNALRTGNVDQIAVLASLTGMNYEFGKTIPLEGGEYGNAILTKHPYTLIGNYPLPGSEPRAALFLDIDLSATYGTTTHITFIATHLDHKRESDRVQSVKNIETIVRSQPAQPILIAGDMNATPGSTTMNEFALNWSIANLGQSLLTYPSGTPNKQLDYVLYRRSVDWAPKSIQVVNEPVASDHRPIYYAYELNLDAPSTPTPSMVLNATGSKSKNQIKVNLSWTGAGSSNVDVYRDNVLILTTQNDGSHTDTISQRSGTFTYKVCEAGTSTCSNESRVAI